MRCGEGAGTPCAATMTTSSADVRIIDAGHEDVVVRVAPVEALGHAAPELPGACRVPVREGRSAFR